ncbi:hypothetical protein A1O1_08057 [Capronia coronata CBS 617.96]|uniref:Uncharacterized protein n=1 Tax=Capronia coronata CBS 617.96 TaxID=1182541 RepID=W9YI68_9EURO|nr:uncharacterized protein A1O1_08057 [Capronia coronata CBS 617.96]EXJ81989.1 hypothetical protein A1O1_08057 [Capronia coronata CBS 617.96]
MHGIRQAFSPLLCCIGFRSSDRDPPSDLSNLQNPASALSIPLPASTVPHAVGQSPSNVADTHALRQIFRSSSSVRGYRTASQSSALPARRQESLDVDFRFGQPGKERKQPGRLEQLGSHIRQKISESRLSKSSSKHHTSDDVAHDSTGMSLQRLAVDIPEAALSQRSTGLLELLMSRGGSEGGYDSDAKSIQTAMLNDTESTTRPSPTTAADVFRTVDVHLSANEDVLTSQSTGKNPPGFQQADTGVSMPSTPSKTSFTKLVLLENKGSPTEVLQRLSDGLSSGTIKLPDAACLMRMTHSPPQNERNNSLNPHGREIDLEFEKALRRLSATVAAVETESLASTAENNRDSLFSNLNPNLIDFISKFAEHSPRSAPTESSYEDIPDGGKIPPTEESTDEDSFKTSIPGGSDALSRDMKSIADSDRSSVHLYNMRISQQLASPSITATGSRPETSRTSIDQAKSEHIDGWPALGRLSLTGSHPSWIAIEHNRRPSDPQTRRLFENAMPLGKSKSQLKNVVSTGTAVDSMPGRGNANDDPASSSHWNEGDIGMAGNSMFRKPRRNPNSIAVGGRSESISLPVGSSSGSISHASIAGESAWFGRRSLQTRQEVEGVGEVDPHIQRQRSASMPTGDKIGYLQVNASQRRHDQGSTEYYETMSEISAEQIQDSRREQLTEVSTQAVHDAFNERMSDIEPDTISGSKRSTHCEIELDPSSRSSERLSFASSDLFPGNGRRRMESDQDAYRLHDSTSRCQETTTDMWRRTFKRAIEEPQHGLAGGFLTAPRFDRNGRRKSSASSQSAANSDREVVTGESIHGPDMSGLQPGLLYKTRNDQKPTIRRSSDTSERTPRLGARRSAPIFKAGEELQRKAPKKKSILDLGRRFTIVGATPDDKRQGSNTPFRDLLGLWARFPSYTREARSGPAGASDGVAVRDFAVECTDENATTYPTPQASWNRSTLSMSLRTPPSWRRLPFGKTNIDKRKSRSLDILRNSINEQRSADLRTKKNGRGLVGKWKRIYRNSSSDLRAYTQTYGHRSSISMSASVEYPELEIIAGHDGSHDSRPFRWGPGANGSVGGRSQQPSEPPEEPLVSGRSEAPQLDSLPWTAMYRDCVGSLSALKSDVNLQQMTEGGEPRRSKDRQGSGEMKFDNQRETAADDEVQPGEEETAKGLIEKIEDTGKNG